MIRPNRTALALLLATSACSEVVTVENSPPVVEALGVCQPEGSDRWYLKLALADQEEQNLDLRLTDPSGLTLAPGPTGSGTQGLPTVAPPGRRQVLVEWGQTGDAAACAAQTADLPGVPSDCRFLDGQPTIPLNLTAVVDDQEAVFETPLVLDVELPATDCTAGR
ncbi:MAG: hypothetical protein H6702_04985 [Myxococcales bacterium]|nr:hypothetical protein [Myxococcales bacterium]